MARAVGYVLGTIQHWASLLGITTGTARRHAAAGKIPGAVKAGPKWVVPLTAKQYAKGAGVSESTARRRFFARGTSPTDPAVIAGMPSNLAGKGAVPVTKGGRMMDARNYPYQYQGDAWIRFVSSGDMIHWYTPVIISKVRLGMVALADIIRNAVAAAFHSSPVEVLRIGYQYAREA